MSSRMLTFGPVPSRRLGRSLGINNIPPKICTYSCVYCQIGRTFHEEIDPRTFYRPDKILQQVTERIECLQNEDERIDYLTFVPDGEPTLDAHLGKIIDLLRPFNFKIAVISNGSLLWRPEVRQRLASADVISVKVDAVDENIWQRINRPHKNLHLNKILAGMQKFSEEYRGHLVTETMLVKGLNDSVESITGVADFIARLSPYKAYVALPTRPPAEHGVNPPNGEAMILAYQIFKKVISNTELLIEYEGEDFTTTDDIRDELLRITSVHPLREEAIDNLLKAAKVGHEVIDVLIKEKKIIMTEYRGKRFYIRNVGQTTREISQISNHL
jgi:wyosine [tRNA(Phe)-imidazoG37] synthetase (radical SAM superfamily)